MFSIFEDEEQSPYRRFGRDPPIDQGKIVVGDITSHLAPYREPGQTVMRKRTRLEALQRVGEPLGVIGQAGKVPFFAPYTKAVQLLTVGLIFVDPLNRLEGTL
jgi:hypothetical protein